MALSVEKIARMINGKIIGDPALTIKGVNSLDAAGEGEVAFFADKRLREGLKHTAASAVIVKEPTDLYKGTQVVAADPQLAFARVTEVFAPPTPRFPGISVQAFVHEGSRVGKDVSIYPHVYVGDGAVIGDETVLFPGAYVGERVVVGKRCVISSNVTIRSDCIVGNDVILHAGVVIGSDGFGYVRDGAASVKVPQIGIVQIDDQVEIGANACVDRAALGKTWIRQGVKIDNLVQIAHNVVIGEHSVVVAQTGFSGSVHVGKNVVIAGQVGVADHLDIGDGAVIGAKSGIAKTVSPGEVLFGTPAMPHRLWLKTSGLVKKLPEFSETLRKLEKRIEMLEKRDSQEELP